MNSVESAVTLCGDVLQVELAARRRDDDLLEPATTGALRQRQRRIQRDEDRKRQWARCGEAIQFGRHRRRTLDRCGHNATNTLLGHRTP